MYDPENGLRIIYYSVRSRTAYSLVIVPPEIPFRLIYERASTNSFVTLKPAETTTWDVDGKIDVDLFYQLGFPVHQSRYGNHPPIITPENVEMARRLGTVERLESNSQGKELFDIQVRLHNLQVLRFLQQVWRPQDSPYHGKQKIPKIQMATLDTSARVLPQKKLLQEASRRDSILKVHV